VTRDQSSGVGRLLLVALCLFLVAPHAAPALERAGIGQALREATNRLPRLPQLGPPQPQPDGQAPSPRAHRAVEFALAQQGKPYRWGAEGPVAFDCSGLTWAAYRAAGVQLPRTAAEQLAGSGPRVTRNRLQPGDLVFFRTNGPTRRHVGLYVGAGRMVEAPNRRATVRVASIRRPGYLGAVRPAPGRGGDRR
jgi:cell wall-associated NlpC family hydrolase